jgi:hypothetical protein
MAEPQVIKENKFQVELTFHIKSTDALKALEAIVALVPQAPVAYNVDLLEDCEDD